MISCDWSSDVCSSDLPGLRLDRGDGGDGAGGHGGDAPALGRLLSAPDRKSVV